MVLCYVTYIYQIFNGQVSQQDGMRSLLADIKYKVDVNGSCHPMRLIQKHFNQNRYPSRACALLMMHSILLFSMLISSKVRVVRFSIQVELKILRL